MEVLHQFARATSVGIVGEHLAGWFRKQGPGTALIACDKVGVAVTSEEIQALREIKSVVEISTYLWIRGKLGLHR